jgi:hypothetical protein
MLKDRPSIAILSFAFLSKVKRIFASRAGAFGFRLLAMRAIAMGWEVRGDGWKIRAGCGGIAPGAPEAV